MELHEIKDLGQLPFQTLTAAALWQLLGPSAVYLGGKTKELTQKSCENIERIFIEASKRLRKLIDKNSQVPPRVLRATLTEGAFTEDAVAAAYLGGVIASSRTGFSRDDRGVVINGLISRLSVYQLRLHYVIYTIMQDLWQGMDVDIYDPLVPDSQFVIGPEALFISMGFIENEFKDDGFNLDSVISHALNGLSNENLLGTWHYMPKRGWVFGPSPFGIEVYLWANGCGSESLEYFLDKDSTRNNFPFYDNKFQNGAV